MLLRAMIHNEHLDSAMQTVRSTILHSVKSEMIHTINKVEVYFYMFPLEWYEEARKDLKTLGCIFVKDVNPASRTVQAVGPSVG